MTYQPAVAIDISGFATKEQLEPLATKDEVTNGLNQKANASTVGGLVTAVNSKAAQSDLDALAGQVSAKATSASVSALAATVPVAANAMPPAVADSGAVGTETSKYALANHTHASKARKGKTTTSAATFTWVYPTAFAAGVAPICIAIAQSPSGNTDLFNVQVEGTPTNTQCVFRINRVSPGLLSLLLGALAINPNPAANVTLHMLALEP